MRVIKKRQLLAKIFSKVGMLPAMRVLDRRQPTLKVLAYHRIKNIDKTTYLFDENLVDASVNNFRHQIAYLARNYRVLPLSKAIEAFYEMGEKDVIAVTFDDGFDDLYYNVFPVLKEQGVSVTMFLTTGLIGTDDTLWSEKVSFAIKSISKRNRHLRLQDGNVSEVVHTSSPSEAIDYVLKKLKLVPNKTRINMINCIIKQANLDDWEKCQESGMLTWEQVQEMSAWGVEFGSHTVTHPVLSQVDDADLQWELQASKETLERYIGKSCPLIAYPVGGGESFNDKVIDFVKSAGYQFGCSYHSDVNHFEKIEFHEINRLHIDRTIDIDWFRSMISYPRLFAVKHSC